MKEFQITKLRIENVFTPMILMGRASLEQIGCKWTSTRAGIHQRWCTPCESEKASKLAGRNAHLPWLQRTPAGAVVALCAVKECIGEHGGILKADRDMIARVERIQVLCQVILSSSLFIQLTCIPVKKKILVTTSSHATNDALIAVVLKNIISYSFESEWTMLPICLQTFICWNLALETFSFSH